MIRLLLMVCLATAAFAGVAQSPDGNLAISYKEMLRRNNASLSQLKISMTKDQVVALMKPYTAGHLTNPYRQESFQRDGATFEVLWYLTRPHRMFVSIKDAQATPVVLKNGSVVGWGPTAVELAK
jgi:hypothetical protein